MLFSDEAMHVPTSRFFPGSTETATLLSNDSDALVSFDSLQVRDERYLAQLDDVVLFEGSSQEEGAGYWVSDGTPEGTYKVAELIVGFDDMGSQVEAEVHVIDAFSVGTEKAIIVTRENGDGGIDSQTTPLYAIDITRPDPLEADLTGDGVVDFADFLVVSANYSQRNATFEDGDIDADGQVTQRDFELIRRAFGRRRTPESTE